MKNREQLTALRAVESDRRAERLASEPDPLPFQCRLSTRAGDTGAGEDALVWVLECFRGHRQAAGSAPAEVAPVSGDWHAFDLDQEEGGQLWMVYSNPSIDPVTGDATEGSWDDSYPVYLTNTEIAALGENEIEGDAKQVVVLARVSYAAGEYTVRQGHVGDVRIYGLVPEVECPEDS